MPVVEILSIVVGLPLALGGVALFFEHRQKMLKLKIELMGQQRLGNGSEIEALRAEIRALRDTTSQYDISFDSALQRMERRMEQMEHRTFDSTKANAEVRAIR